MLNDREREALSEMERRLLSDDPSYSQSFNADAKLLPAGDTAEYMRRAYPFLLMLSLAFAILFFMVGSSLSACAFLTVTALTWVARRGGYLRKGSRP